MKTTRNDSIPTANYTQYGAPKKSDTETKTAMLYHFPTSQERKTAIDIIRWTYAVAGIRPDSPRFAYYVSRWNVPFKVSRAISAGTFADTVKNCPPLDPAWPALVPAALKESEAFNAATSKPPIFSSTPRHAIK